MALGDILSGDQPIKIDVDSTDLKAALKDNAAMILIGLFIMIVLAIVVAEFLKRIIFKT